LNERPDFDPEEPGIDISYQFPTDDGSGRVIVFRSLVPQSCSDDQFNMVLDKFSRAAERQKALSVMPTYQEVLDVKKAALMSETEQAFQARVVLDTMTTRWHMEAETSQRRNWKPSPAQTLDRQKAEAAIKQHEQNIAVLEKQIASEEKRLTLYKGRLGEGA
jgi:hypothetical protein